MKSVELLLRLNEIPKDEVDLAGPLYDALDDVDMVEDPEELFSAAFEFMRDQSEADFGAPGPLSHLIEKYFPLYVNELARSLSIKPTEPTLFLARRIFNSARLTDNKEAVKVLPIMTDALNKAKDQDGIQNWVLEEIEDILNR